MACAAASLAAALATHVCASDRKDFAAAMLSVFVGVTCYAEANFHGECLPFRTNLHIHEWASLCSTKENDLTLSYLTWFSCGL